MSNDKKEKFYLTKQTPVFAHSCIFSQTLKDFWQNCSVNTHALQGEETKEYVFRSGKVKMPTLEDSEYAVSVQKSGAYAIAKNEKSLIRAVVSLAQKIELDENIRPYVSCCEYKSKPLVQNQMTHFCIFPETELYEIEKFVRLCGVIGYTHIILEFWGMLKYDCMKELAWTHAFSKEQLRPIIRVANEFGMDVVPMFNHWGHASASRHMNGKHVVLDRDPALCNHFTDFGWCWNYKNPDTKNLLRSVREELFDLCGKGEFFHIGCDEADGFDFEKESIDEFCSFIRETTDDLARLGRRPVLWGDMFVARHPEFDKENAYCTNSKSLESENAFLSKLDKRVVIADWQYDCRKYPVETSYVFKNRGFDTLICPWDRSIENSHSCAVTARDGFFGIIHTTWHTLSSGYPLVLSTALSVNGYPPKDMGFLGRKTADLLRKAFPANGDYKKAGWAKNQISELH